MHTRQAAVASRRSPLG